MLNYGVINHKWSQKYYSNNILLLYIFWIVGYHRDCYSKLHEIDEKYKV